MQISDATSFFAGQFREKVEQRWIGIENEYPVVYRESGVGVAWEVIEHFWQDLERNHHWQLFQDPFTGKTVRAIQQSSVENNGQTAYDEISIDTGHHILEIGLSPSATIQDLEAKLRQRVSLITSILADHEAAILGYGVQPITRLSDDYISPKSQYRLYQANIKSEEFKGFYQPSLQYLGLSASSQTHVDVARFEAMGAVNMLNATTGLRIGLFGNSPIWQGAIGDFDATRELFWDWSYPSRKSQLGIPPKFQDIAHYLDYLMGFRIFTVKRDAMFLRLNNHTTFRQFFLNENGCAGTTPTGDDIHIQPMLSDLNHLATTAWFNARIQASFSTVEERSICQQPPSHPLSGAALNLGLVENMTRAVDFADQLSLDQWRDIRILTCTSGFRKSYPGVNLREQTLQMLDIAAEGLRGRGCSEEAYLSPLYERIESGKSLADRAREKFTEGLSSFIDHYDMKNLT
jgi:gamma-glutamylcysteine synthetase